MQMKTYLTEHKNQCEFCRKIYNAQFDEEISQSEKDQDPSRKFVKIFERTDSGRLYARNVTKISEFKCFSRNNDAC